MRRLNLNNTKKNVGPVRSSSGSISGDPGSSSCKEVATTALEFFAGWEKCRGGVNVLFFPFLHLSSQAHQLHEKQFSAPFFNNIREVTITKC